MKNRSNLFSIEVLFGCAAPMKEVRLVATFNKGFVFLFSDEITDNRVNCSAPVSGGKACARKIRFSARIFAIFIMSWSRPRHYSFVLLFLSLCSLRCTPVRDHGIRIRRPRMYTRDRINSSALLYRCSALLCNQASHLA